MSSKAKNKSHIKRCGKPACLPVLFTQAHVWGFHRIGPARSLSFPWPNEDRMCALLFCRNVRFSKQWGGEKGQKRAWTCLHVCCVKLVKLVLRLGGIWKGIQHRRKRSTPRSTPGLEGTNKLHSSWETARARRNCQILFTLLCLSSQA